MRNKTVDAFMELLFGKPDFSKSFIDQHGCLRTPLGDGKLRIWRIDPIEKEIQTGGKPRKG